MTEKSKRITYLDNAKGIGIILVIMGHTYMNIEHLRLIYAFHMPLFFMLSGMLIHIKKEYNLPFKTIFIKKIKSMMIPYISFSVIYLVYYLIKGLQDSASIPSFYEQIYNFFSLYGIDVMWFLPALFMGELACILFVKALLKLKVRAWVAHLITSAVLFAFSMFLYVLWTNILSLFESIVIYKLCVFLIRVIFVAFFIEISYFVILLTNIKIKKFMYPIIGFVLLAICLILSTKLGAVNFQMLAFDHILPAFINAIIGSVGIVCLVYLLPDIKILSFFGRNSLIIFATHFCVIIGYIMILVQNINKYIHFGNDKLNYLFFILGTLILTLAVEIPIILLINNCFPFMIGKKYKKKQTHSN